MAKTFLKPVGVIKARLGIQKNGPVQAFFTNACYRYMGSFVPGGADSFLNRNVTLETDRITYKSPYSHYMWFGKVMGPNIPIEKEGDVVAKWVSPKGKPKYYTGKDIKYKTPGTGSHWDTRMWSSKREKVVKEVREYVNRGCK